MQKTPEQWLEEAVPEKKGSIFKLFLGYAPGVGKTFSMLSEAIRRHARGEEVVIGIVETHGRKGTAELAEQLETIPRKKLEYKGATFEEMDVDVSRVKNWNTKARPLRRWPSMRSSRASRTLFWWMSWPTPTSRAVSTGNAMRMFSNCWMRV